MSNTRKTWYEFKNQAGKTIIDIQDEIGGWGVDAKSFRADFANIPKGSAVTVHINSPGGSIIDGNEIYNTLRDHDGEVTVEIGALCASIASVIAMAGKTVIAKKNSLLMIHNPSVMAAGGSDEMRKMADIMDKMKANIIAAYKVKTGKDEKELSDMMDAETWMTAEEAKDAGFVDEMDEAEGEDATARFDLSRFRNSANFLAKINASKPAAEPAGSGGNAAPVAKVEEGGKDSKQTPTTKQQEKNTMTPDEIEAKAKADAEKMYKAKLARDKEIRDTVSAVLKRDKKDFSALADKFIAEDKSVDEFCRAIATSNEFKPAEVVGSGIEVVEPIDALKGTPGFNMVTSEHFRAVATAWQKHGRHSFNLNLTIPEFKNTQTSSGLTSIEYRPGIAELGVRPLRVKEIIAGGATNSTTIRSRVENAFADAATSVAETGALPNLSVSYTEVDNPVKDIGGYIEMSENLMADYLAIGSFINQRVPYMIERVVEDQLLNGAGAGSDLIGILARSGVQTQAKGGDTAIDAIYKAITNVEFVPNATQANAQGGYIADYILVNPTDWQNIRLLKDTANQYYGGGPFTGAYGNGGFSNVDVLWGKTVIRTPAIAQGTALVGAFKQCAQWFQRQGLTIEMTNSNGTNFINRIVTLRAAERLALTVDLPNGFCQVTGL